MTWGVYEYHDSIHVMPNDDTKDHFFDECECGVRYENGVYIHSSYDKRELFEEMPCDGDC